jgi:hypothetical protein
MPRAALVNFSAKNHLLSFFSKFHSLGLEDKGLCVYEVTTRLPLLSAASVRNQGGPCGVRGGQELLAVLEALRVL